jgi:trehalose-phosphatase
VLVVSGRDLDDLRSRTGLPGVALAGGHGGELLLAGGERREVGLVPADVERVDAFASFAERLLDGTGGEVERKRHSTAAHTRRVDGRAQSWFEEILVAAARKIAAGGDLEVVPGKCVVELRSRAATKDRALRAFRAGVPGAWAVAIGDDVTDEDLFREAVRGGGTAIKVGAGASIAPHRLEDPEAVARFLEALAATRAVTRAA